MPLRHPTRDLEEQPVGELHDVGLVGGGDLPPAVGLGVVEGRLHDPLGAEDRDRLDRDPRVRADGRAVQLLQEAAQVLRLRRVLLELDPGVQVLGVLPDDHDVGLGEAGADALIGLAGTDARVEVELLAQEHVDRAKARAHGRGGGALDAHPVALDRLQRAVRERRALLGVDVLPGRLLVPVELDAGGLQHAAGGLDELRAGAVAGDDRDVVCHAARDAIGGLAR